MSEKNNQIETPPLMCGYEKKESEAVMRLLRGFPEKSAVEKVTLEVLIRAAFQGGLSAAQNPPVLPAKLDKGGKAAYLFYWEEAQDAWCSVPHLLENVVSTDLLTDGDEMEIRFKRSDMTPEDFAAIPEE